MSRRDLIRSFQLSVVKKYLINYFERRERWPVHLVCKSENGQFPHPANFKKLPRSIFDSLGSIDEHLFKSTMQDYLDPLRTKRKFLTTQLSAAARVRYVSSEKSWCPGVSRRFNWYLNDDCCEEEPDWREKEFELMNLRTWIYATVSSAGFLVYSNESTVDVTEIPLNSDKQKKIRVKKIRKRKVLQTLLSQSPSNLMLPFSDQLWPSLHLHLELRHQTEATSRSKLFFL